MGRLVSLMISASVVIVLCMVETNARPRANNINGYYESFWQNTLNNQWRSLFEPMPPTPDTRQGFGNGRPFGLLNSMSSSPQLGIINGHGHGFGPLPNGWAPAQVQLPSALHMGQTLQVGGTALVSSSHLEQMHLGGQPTMANVVFGSGTQHSLVGESIQQISNLVGTQNSGGHINGGGSEIYHISTNGDVNHIVVQGQSDATGSGTIVQESYSDTEPQPLGLGDSNPIGDAGTPASFSESLHVVGNDGASAPSLSDSVQPTAEIIHGSDTEESNSESNTMAELEGSLPQGSNAIQNLDNLPQSAAPLEIPAESIPSDSPGPSSSAETEPMEVSNTAEETLLIESQDPVNFTDMGTLLQQNDAITFSSESGSDLSNNSDTTGLEDALLQ